MNEAALDTSALDQALQLAVDLNGCEADADTGTATGVATRAAKATAKRRALRNIKEGHSEPFIASAASDAAGWEYKDSAELDRELWYLL